MNSEQQYTAKCPEEVAPYARVFLAELCDSRLDSNDKVLLALIRYRVGTNASSWASYETLAQDLGWGESTVRAHAARLRELGHLECRQRGLGMTDLKMLLPASSCYDPNIFLGGYSLMRKDRTKADISRLRSEPVQDAEEETSNDSMGAMMAADVIAPRKRSSSSWGSVKVKKSEIAKEEIKTIKSSDDAPTGHRPVPQLGDFTEDSEESGLEYETQSSKTDKFATSSEDRFFQKRKGEEIQTTPSVEFVTSDPEPARASPVPVLEKDTSWKDKVEAMAAKRAAETAMLSANRHSDLMRKRQEKIEKGEEQEVAKKQRKQNRFVTKDGSAKANDVEMLFHELMGQFFPGIPDSKWDIKDLKLAKNLLEAYKQDLVEKVLRRIFANWSSIKGRYAKNDLGPVPTIAVLYGWRTKWFPEQAIMEQKTQKSTKNNSDDDWAL